MRFRLGRDGSDDFARALALARRADVPGLEIQAGAMLALTVELRGDGERATALFATLRTLLPRLQPVTRADYHIKHADVLARQGHLAEALAAIERAATTTRDIGDRLGQLQCAAFAGGLRYEIGDFERARADLTDSHRALIALGERRMGGIALCALGRLAQEEGDLDEAERCLAEAARLEEDLADPLAHRFRGYLGDLALERGRFEEARAHHRAALAGQRAVGEVRAAAAGLASLAVAEAGCGALDEATAHLEACRAAADFPDKDRIVALTSLLVDLARAKAAEAAGEADAEAPLGRSRAANEP